MTADEALRIIDRFLQSDKLNNLQELIFRQSWQDKTYQEIAANSGYTDDYIREQGGKLWKLLSKVLNEKINKKNFKAVLERHFRQKKTVIINDRQNWQEAVDVSLFCGRSEELTTLERLIVKDKCRLLGVFGIGGIGKTSLTVKLAHQVASEFDFVIWRSLCNAPSCDRLVTDIIHFLSLQLKLQPDSFPDTNSKISQLIKYLRSHRCLLILDNVESILQGGTTCGKYQAGYEDYGKLIQSIARFPHQSCVVLTSREKPLEFTSLSGNQSPVRSLQLKGVTVTTGKKICQFKGKLWGTERNWQTLANNYSGNPLALKIVAATIQEVFDGDINQFLQQGIFSFDEIEHLLGEQLNRLSELEKEVMYWLAIERKPISLNHLQQNLLTSISHKKLLEAIKSLNRRSLIEKTTMGFTQQPVIMEYLIEHQIDKVDAKTRIKR